MDQTGTVWRIERSRTEVLIGVAVGALVVSAFLATGIVGEAPFDHDQVSVFNRILLVLSGLYGLIEIAKSVVRGSEVIQVELESRRILIERRRLFHPEIVERRDVPFAEVANVKVVAKSMGGQFGCSWYELICQFKSGEKVCLGTDENKCTKKELEARRDFLVRHLEEAGVADRSPTGHSRL